MASLDTPFSLKLRTLKHLSYRLSFPFDRIQEIRQSKAKRIHHFQIVKTREDGTKKIRDIYHPQNEYKVLLRRINRNLLNYVSLPSGVCGGISGKNLHDMVDMHCGKEALFKIDLKDFYPSISTKRVFHLFLDACCSPDIAELLADLTTLDNHLPQGFPTSTMLANFAAYRLDHDHLAISKRLNLARTRWIDDIAFSGRRMNLETAIPKIESAVKHNKFILNKRKSVLSHRGQCPNLVNLEIGRHHPSIPDSIIDRLEDILISSRDNGLAVTIDAFQDELNIKAPKQSLSGKINFIAAYNPVDALRLESIFNQIDWS